MWQQEGMVLLLALVFVLMLALVVGVVVRSGTLQLHMAANDQQREEASHVAQDIAAELVTHPENFSLAAAVGYTRCAPGGAGPGCDNRDLVGPAAGSAGSGYQVDYRVTRRAPLLWNAPAPRGGGTELTGGDVAIFEIDVRVEGLGAKPGRARAIQGVAVVVSGEWRVYPVSWREQGVDPV